MSGASTPNVERDAALLSVGHQCSDPSCSLVDFLPFKCQHCSALFCQDHFLPTRGTDGRGHACDKYDESKANRIAPSCPLCSTPVSIPSGQDPNVRMDQHITNECSVTTGRRAKSNLPHCARPSCGKVLYAPISCTTCRRQFCPSHRFPSQHTCSPGATTASAPASSQPAKQQIGQAKEQIGQSMQQAGARGAAAMAAIKRSLASSSAAPAPTAQSSSSSAGPASKPAPAAGEKKLNPFSATDRVLHVSPPTEPVSASPVSQPAPAPDASSSNELVKPAPVIDPLAWAPPPLFASA